ncbi:MAG: DUF5666 domain-containing protein [Terracidiphilus sp.]|jgi:hypothetical protein
MNVRLLILVVLAVAITASAQDTQTSPPTQPPTQTSGQSQGRGGGRGGWGGGGGGMMGRGVLGTVTEVAADHYTIKTDAGLTYTIHYSANTRILKQQPQPAGSGQGRGAGQGGGQWRGGEGGGNPPQAIKPTDIKVGDAITAMGEVDANAKSVGAVAVIQLDPERAKQMREMQANYGKTWIAGKVTAIDGVKVTLMGAMDNTAHSFVADENTTFRKRRDPITLGDIQVGDTVRVEGALKDGTFLATTVNAMGQPPAGGPPAGPAGSVPPQ